MLDKLPIKKEYLLIAATIILLWVGYQFAFKNTIEAWQLNSQLKNTLAQSADISYQPNYLDRKNTNLNKILNLYKADTLGFRNNVINTIAAIAEKNNTRLTEVPLQDVTYSSPHFIIEKLSFEGDYFSLVKVANQLESTNSIGIIRAENLKIVGLKSSSDNLKKLILEVYLEIAK